VTDYRVPFMLVGIAINAVAVVLAAHRLSRVNFELHGA
jgi:hypothetical protein